MTQFIKTHIKFNIDVINYESSVCLMQNAIFETILNTKNKHPNNVIHWFALRLLEKKMLP